MGVGRFVCVAIPLILIIGAIISLLVATLAGVTHESLRLFTVDLRDLDIGSIADLGGIQDLLDENGLGDINLDDLDLGDISEDVPIEDILNNVGDNIGDIGGDIGDIAGDLGDEAGDIGGDIGDIAGDLGDEAGDIISDITSRSVQKRQNIPAFALRYEINLWGYCALNSDGDRNCTDAEFNWADEGLNITTFEEIGRMIDPDFNIPDSLDNALDIFREVIMWAQIAFIVALVALGLELVVGIFANFSRVVSCLTWLIASLATVLTIIAAGLGTATAVVVVGVIEASDDLFGAQASFDTNFLVAVWIAAALALVAGLFWVITICCCKPERRRREKRGSADAEKLIPGSTAYAPLGNDQPYQSNYTTGTARDFSSGTSDRGDRLSSFHSGPQRTSYAPVGNDHEMTSGNYYNSTPPQFDPTYTSTGYTGTSGARNDQAYEPFSHRA